MTHYEVDCPTCGARCAAATTVPLDNLVCWKCHHWILPRAAQRQASSTATVGLIGGAALGAGVGGPFGAIVGGILGALIGSGGRRRQ